MDLLAPRKVNLLLAAFSLPGPLLFWDYHCEGLRRDVLLTHHLIKMCSCRNSGKRQKSSPWLPKNGGCWHGPFPPRWCLGPRGNGRAEFWVQHSSLPGTGLLQGLKELGPPPPPGWSITAYLWLLVPPRPVRKGLPGCGKHNQRRNPVTQRVV